MTFKSLFLHLSYLTILTSTVSYTKPSCQKVILGFATSEAVSHESIDDIGTSCALRHGHYCSRSYL